MHQVQVNQRHYDFMAYVSEERFCSYYRQIVEIIESNAKTVLLIGVGDGIVQTIINKIMPQIIITTMDFDSTLNPDICCDITEISMNVTEKYDAVVCCQVLEHLPYDCFDNILMQMRQILTKNGKLILSLPDRGVKFRIYLHIPGFRDINIYRKFCRFYKKNFTFNGEHYWEINICRLYNVKCIREKISQIYQIDKEYLVPNNLFHRFFILSI